MRAGSACLAGPAEQIASVREGCCGPLRRELTWVPFPPPSESGAVMLLANEGHARMLRNGTVPDGLELRIRRPCHHEVVSRSADRVRDGGSLSRFSVS
jgi:hypothetical protein